ncbi:hypothetical protein GCM10022280_01570 [Sphingomonas swuensis]|uniref:Carboxypeptidase regulatory-like domain-containing protein n=1 Tax=Sphingomonas swuensis TaxID=977800 RepID=A0ABP7S8Z2_9SPHN
MRRLLVLAAAVSSFGATASAPEVRVPWNADPDSQYLLDVQIRQKILGEGVRAYPVPGGSCVILGDLAIALDLPIKIDLKARVAEGWAFKEENRLRIDRATATVTYGKRSERLTESVVRDAPDGWCVETAALSRWLGLTMSARTEASVLLLEHEEKLPVERAIERRERAAQLHRASLDLSGLPKVRLPYRMWRSPSVDVMMDAGVTYSAATGTRIDHRASIIAAGEALQMSYEARVGTDRRGLPTNVRLRAYRSDPEAGLLGPLKATHVAFGDVEGLSSPSVGASGSGRGAVVTNRPLLQAVAFDRTQFSGELSAGWDAELYRNGELVAFAPAGSDQRYRFDEVALQYGENRFEILSYGPQGQVRSRIETVTVGPQAVPPGESWYWAGVVDPGRDLLDFRRERGPPSNERGLRAAASFEHGIDQRTSVAALVQTLVVDDQRVTYVEGAVRRSIGPAVAEVALARDDTGGLALRGQVLARVGAASLSWSSFLSRGFAARPEGSAATAEHRLSVDVPLKLSGDRVIPLHGDVRMSERRGGGRTIEANARTSVTISRFNLAALGRWRQTRAGEGFAPTDELEAGLIGSGRIGRVRVRGTTEWQISPESRLKRAELSGYWSRGGNADWEGALAYESIDRRVRGRLTHVRRFDSLAIAGTLEAASDGSVAAGLNLTFSLDRGREGWRFSRQSLAGAGSVRAQVFRDRNGNGLRDGDEKVEQGAFITAGLRPGDRPTGKDGWASVAGLDNYRAVAIGVDTGSLSDPNLVPAKPAQMVVPRPGVSAEVLIPLVGGGAVEGTLLKDGGGAFQGLNLELVDAGGRVVASATSDYDGYFLFERVAAGRYTLRLTEMSRVAAKARTAEVKAEVVLKEEQAVLRLGSLTVQATAAIAVNQEVVPDDLPKMSALVPEGKADPS